MTWQTSTTFELCIHCVFDFEQTLCICILLPSLPTSCMCALGHGKRAD